MKTYAYSGPVYEFDTCINEHWQGETRAVSEKKAKSNLAYQYKRSHSKSADTKITLPGNVIELKGE